MKAPKVLADILESVAGAVYVDVDFNLQKFWLRSSGAIGHTRHHLTTTPTSDNAL